MSAPTRSNWWIPVSEECDHYSYECYYGNHYCADCKEFLGTGDNPLFPHPARDCGICGASAEHEGIPCRIPHPCSYKYPAMAERQVKEQGAVFVTKDSGQRFTFESGMQRDTQEGKARFDLLFPLDVPYDDQFLTRVAELLARGAEKYDERNWEQAEGMVEMNRFKASAARHFAQWMSGELDEDHAAAVVFNLLGAETLKWKMDQNEDPAR